MLLRDNDNILGAVVKLIVNLMSEQLIVIHDLLVKISSVNSREWFTELKKFLRKDETWSEINRWPIWNVLRVTGKEAKDFRRDFSIASIVVINSKNIFDKIIPVAEKGEYELTVVSGIDLGLVYERGVFVSYEDIYTRAVKNGLQICSAEFGPLTAWQFGRHIERGKDILVAMPPIVAVEYCPVVFCLERQDGAGELWLKPECVGEVSPEKQWLFIRRKR